MATKVRSTAGKHDLWSGYRVCTRWAIHGNALHRSDSAPFSRIEGRRRTLNEVVRHALGENPGFPALGLNRLRVRVVTGGDGAAPVLCGGTASVLKTAAHGAGDRHIHAAVTRPVIRRRVFSQGPHRGGSRNDGGHHAHRDEHPAAFARRERVCWRSLAPGAFEGFRQGHESLAKWALDEATPMELNRTLNPSPDMRQIRLTHQRACELLPELRRVAISNVWASYIDSTPDGVPAIGEVEAIPGFILAAGFSGHGFGIGPGARHMIADIITGSAPIVDPRPYRLERLKMGAWGKVAEF